MEEILEGHVLLLIDPEMTGQMETSIADDKMCAEAAVEKICDYYMQMFSSIDDEMFQQRATDVCDIKTRLLKILLDVEDVDLECTRGNCSRSRRLNSIYDCRNQP